MRHKSARLGEIKMKNIIKRVAITLIVLLALLGAGTGIAFASGYIQWGGTDDYQETLTILDQIEQRSNELGTERGQMVSYILHLEAEIEDLQARLDNGSKTGQDQMKQAEEDMNHVKERSQEVLENLRDSFSR